MAQFEKGKPRPPNAGRRAGTPNRRTDLERHLISQADDRAIVDAIVVAAKAGDHKAQELYLRYFRPRRPRVNPTPINVVKPVTAEDVRSATAELLVRVLAGEVDLDAANAASALLKAADSSIVIHDLQKLVDELKARQKT
jgi:hypothetical protein